MALEGMSQFPFSGTTAQTNSDFAPSITTTTSPALDIAALCLGLVAGSDLPAHLSETSNSDQRLHVTLQQI